MTHVAIVVADIAIAAWWLAMLTDPTRSDGRAIRFGYALAVLFLLAAAALRVHVMLAEAHP